MSSSNKPVDSVPEASAGESSEEMLCTYRHQHRLLHSNVEGVTARLSPWQLLAPHWQAVSLALRWMGGRSRGLLSVMGIMVYLTPANTSAVSRTALELLTRFVYIDNCT